MGVIISIHHADAVSLAAQAIQRGAILCVPTETVYGFVCSTCNRETIERLARIKGRPENKPFAVFASSWERMKREAIDPGYNAERLAAEFFPGPLTLVVPARSECPGEANGSVGVRCPNHEFVQALLAECGGLLINTSMNRSGEPEYRSLQGIEGFFDSIDLSIDGGALPQRLPSTVVDCRVDPPAILRVGEITEKMILAAIRS